MKKVMKELGLLRKKHKSILECIDEIEVLRLQLKKPEDILEFVNIIRGIVQDEAKQAVINNGGIGMVAMATGSGKSRVAVELAKHYFNPQNDYHAALLVPTEKLRDENWLEEFTKWEGRNLWTHTTRACYASASKIEGYDFPLAILDEGHNLTELSSEFFSNNKVERVVLLTATPPTDVVKIEILRKLNIPLVYQLGLDQAVRLGFVAPYKITVITVPLNTIDKDVTAGSKTHPFMQTERAAYDYYSSKVDASKYDFSLKGRKDYKFAILGRMQLIYKFKSKTAVIKYLLDKVIPQDDRTLIFCGSIAQADEVCEERYHSKSGSVAYNKFKEEKINRLSCVKAINEGHNFPGMDSGIIGQLNSKEKDLVQRIGRLVRFRPGHEAHIYILASEDTQDEKWLESALENLDKDKVNKVKFSNFKEQFENDNQLTN
jgi:superfamily II DNA or RNA helicase